MITKLIPVGEVARQAGVCSATALRKIKAAGFGPDAMLLAGTRKSPTPLYLAERKSHLVALITTNEN